MKPLIGIVSRPHRDDDGGCELGIMDTYRNAVVKNGGNAICILPTQYFIYEENSPYHTPKMTNDEIEMLKNQLSLCSGIVMPGGSKWYEYDEIICKYCLENDIPILGICMGEQIMGNVILNNQEISGDKTIKNDSKINHMQPSKNYVHTVKINENSKLFQIIGNTEIKVNSRHNYHIESKEAFNVVATAPDGIIEAIEYPNKRFAIGLQWHPESLIEFDDNANKIFKIFIEEAKKVN